MKKYLALLALILLAGCGPRLEFGSVISKKHEPAKEWKGTKYDSFEEETLHGIWYDDEDWILVVKGKVKPKDEEEVTQNWYVSEYWYNKVEVGGDGVLSFDPDSMEYEDPDYFEED